MENETLISNDNLKNLENSIDSLQRYLSQCDLDKRNTDINQILIDTGILIKSCRPIIHEYFKNNKK